MSGSRNSLYIDAEGPDPEAIAEAIEWLSELGREDTDRREALLAVNTEEHLHREDVLATVIGERAVQQLEHNRPVRIGDVTIQLLTQGVDPRRQTAGPILAVYPDEELLDILDRMHGVTDVLVVPWSRDEVEHWIAKWNPRQPGESPAQTGRRLWEE